MNMQSNVTAAAWHETPEARSIAGAIVALHRVSESIAHATHVGREAASDIGHVRQEWKATNLVGSYGPKMSATGTCRSLWDRLGELRDTEIARLMAAQGFHKNWCLEVQDKARVDRGFELQASIEDDLPTVADAVSVAFGEG